jgi:hypothetical protein
MKKEHKRNPPGAGKKEGPDIKPVMPAENLRKDEETTKRNERGEDESAKNARLRHSNRNIDKDDRMNAGGDKQ